MARAKHLAGAQIPKICFPSSCAAKEFAFSAERDGDDVGFSGDAFLIWPKSQNKTDGYAHSPDDKQCFGANRVFLSHPCRLTPE